MSLDGYSWELSDRVGGLPEMERSARALAESHCEVVVQVGTNWVHAAGTGPAEIGETINRISREIGVPFLMAGQCIVDALNRLGVRRIGVANSYYRDDWRDGINRYLRHAGFEIATSGSIVDQGIVSSPAEAREIEAATHWNYPPAIVERAILETYEAASDVDAVVQTGSGFRTLDLLNRIERVTGVPVIPSDAAAFWRALDVLDLRARPGYGSLLDSTRD
jgi:maleate isomerase